MHTNKLVYQILKGNAEAEKEFFFLFAAKVLTICRRYVVDDAMAKDLMQECFLKIFDKLEQYDTKKGKLEGWIYKISTNVILQQIRPKKRAIITIYPEVLPDKDEGIDEDTFCDISNDTLIEAIHELPEGYRQILNLYVFEEMKHKDIALYLGIAESTSRSQYTRAKTLLKSILQKKAIDKDNWKLAL